VACVYCQNTLANVFEDTEFFLTVGNEYGCKAVDTVWIYTSAEIDPREVLNIPNAITPNGDGVNDSWNIRNLNLYPNNEIIILNRWGSEMYRQGPYTRNWNGTYNGTDSPAGAYYYLIKLNNIGEVLTGPLTVIR
jgi:gliding motility-associated-like protein